MSTVHPITELAEKLGRISSQFEPGTLFYNEVVQQVRVEVDRANTRDELEQVVQKLRTKLTPRLMDDQMDEFEQVISSITGSDEAWPVEAFKEGFRRGTGEELPDEGTAAGRRINGDLN